jgi:DivIVA domain-containing protein
MVVVLAVVVFATVAAAVGRTDTMVSAGQGRPLPELPEDRALRAEDMDDLRLSVGFRGYRMDEVDLVLDRVQEELARRDARIAELERQLGAAVTYIRSMQQRG